MLVSGAVFVLSGCASIPTSDHAVRDTGEEPVHRVEWGEVTAVREVTLSGESGGLGWLAGEVSDTDVEQAATTEAGVEVQVLLERGESIVVLQAADEVFRVGDSVRVIRRADGGVRVVQ
jgi:outer membrane lipoprotein SlyB